MALSGNADQKCILKLGNLTVFASVAACDKTPCSISPKLDNTAD